MQPALTSPSTGFAMPVLPSVRAMNRLRGSRRSRSAEVVDTLVYLLAGMLLPAWLLGHLFLTFYPAPKASLDGLEDVAFAADSLTTESEGNDPKLPPVEGGSTPSGDSERGSLAKASESGDLNSDQLRFDELTQQASSLEAEIASLKTANQKLASDNSVLQQAANQPNAAVEDSQVSELRDQLQATNENLSAIETRYSNAESERLRLEAALRELQSELERTESELLATKNGLPEMDAIENSDSSPFSLVPANESNSTPNVEMAEEVERAKATVSQLQTTVASLEDKLRVASDSIAARDSELDSTKTELESARIANSNLKNALSDANQRITNLELPKEVFRDFLSSKGSVSKMAFIRWEDDNVIVRSFADKRLYRLTLDRFSEADQQYLLERKTSPTVR